MSILQHLGGHLRGSFTPETLARARGYADGGRVESIDVTEDSDDYAQASAEVVGSHGIAYLVDIAVVPRARDGSVQVVSECDCPVTHQCKHGAALAMLLARATGAVRVARGWRDELAEVLGELDELRDDGRDRPGVALQVQVVRPQVRYGYDLGPRLMLRPLRAGARQAWVKSGISWSGIASAIARSSYDLDQLRALERMHHASMSRGGAWWASDDGVPVEHLGPDAVGMLRDAVQAGVTLVPVPPLLEVTLVEEVVRLTADVTLHEGTARLQVGVQHDGRVWTGAEVTTYGDPAHVVGLGSGEHVALARLDRPLRGGVLRALRRPDPVSVPAAELDDLPDVIGQVRARLAVVSSDASVVVPEAVPPRLRVTVAWSAAESAEVAWQWVYGDHPPHDILTELPLAVVRDRRAERVLLARVEPTPETARQTVAGVDVLHLALLELPAWRAVDGLEVVELDRPHFRESDATPEFAFVVPEPAEGAGAPLTGPTDWLDLEVQIVVEGEAVSLPDVLAALTLGAEHIVLPSGLYVRADRPEFERLAQTVRAAADLHGTDPDAGPDAPGAALRLRVGSGDLGTWAELADLGSVDDVGEAGREWVRRAQALRDLTTLPRPEPVGLVSELRPYQREGFHWLAFLWQHGLGGILADDMGLGKTLQVLALVAHAQATAPGGPPFLVVAPTSVVSAWVGEAARHTPGLRVVAVTASAARRRRSIADLAADADVVVTTYTLLRLEADAYAAVSWGGLVLDEAQQVKNHQSKAFAAARSVRAPFRLAVTGTPFENRLLELWSLLAITCPGLYPRTRTFVEQVVTPVEKQGDAAALARFTRRIKPFVMRRTKDLVAADLPPKQEQVLDVDLTPKHRKLYDAHLARERQSILGLIDDDFDSNRVTIFAALTRLRQLALDAALVDPDHDQVGSAKIDVLVDHLREIAAEGHRALVFSQFTRFLGRVRDRLDVEGLSHVYLDGSTTKRGAVVKKFQTGTDPVFLISLKAGGVGLTLTEADYVFVLDPWWNPAAEAQAVDRAHRIGQHKTVMVYRLVSRDTIEDKVMALKARKAALFAQVLDGGTGLADTITADDIRGLFD